MTLCMVEDCPGLVGEPEGVVVMSRGTEVTSFIATRRWAKPITRSVRWYQTRKSMARAERRRREAVKNAPKIRCPICEVARSIDEKQCLWCSDPKEPVQCRRCRSMFFPTDVVPAESLCRGCWLSVLSEQDRRFVEAGEDSFPKARSETDADKWELAEVLERHGVEDSPEAREYVGLVGEYRRICPSSSWACDLAGLHQEARRSKRRVPSFPPRPEEGNRKSPRAGMRRCRSRDCCAEVVGVGKDRRVVHSETAGRWSPSLAFSAEGRCDDCTILPTWRAEREKQAELFPTFDANDAAEASASPEPYGDTSEETAALRRLQRQSRYRGVLASHPTGWSDAQDEDRRPATGRQLVERHGKRIVWQKVTEGRRPRREKSSWCKWFDGVNSREEEDRAPASNASTSARRRSRIDVGDEPEEGPAAQEDVGLLANTLAQHRPDEFRAVYARLNAHEKAVFHARYVHGLYQREVAARFASSTQSINNTLSRIRAKFEGAGLKLRFIAEGRARNKQPSVRGAVKKTCETKDCRAPRLVNQRFCAKCKATWKAQRRGRSPGAVFLQVWPDPNPREHRLDTVRVRLGIPPQVPGHWVATVSRRIGLDLGYGIVLDLLRAGVAFPFPWPLDPPPHCAACNVSATAQRAKVAILVQKHRLVDSTRLNRGAEDMPPPPATPPPKPA